MSIVKLDTSIATTIKSQQYFHNAYTIVKELVENSIDAHSTRITITLTDTTIIVEDNGTGADLDKIGLRGFTSKKEETDNILGITDKEFSYGYRGQALFALSQLADVEILSCQGKIAFKKKIGEEKTKTFREKGTTVTVKNLFKNTPVRKNMLSIKNEIVKIVFLLKHYIFVHTVQIKCVFNGKIVFCKAGNANVPRILHDLNPITKITTKKSDDFNLFLTDTNSKEIFLFYRKRPLFDNQIVKTIKSCFSSFHLPDLMTVLEIKTKCDCNISADKASVIIPDRINLSKFINKSIEEFSVEFNCYSTPISSPIKKIDISQDFGKKLTEREIEMKKIEMLCDQFGGENPVKFENGAKKSKVVFEESLSADSSQLMSQVFESDLLSQEKTTNNFDLSQEKTNDQIFLTSKEVLKNYESVKNLKQYSVLKDVTNVQKKSDLLNNFVKKEETVLKDVTNLGVQNSFKDDLSNSQEKMDVKCVWDCFKEIKGDFSEVKFKKENFSDMEIIGQFNNGFILCKLVGEKCTVLVIDQHAADEIFNYEKLSQNFKLSTQKIVIPIELNLSPVDEFVVENNQRIFERHGFFVKNGKLETMPIYKGVDFDLDDFFELLECVKNNAEFGKIKNVLATKACRMSIMIGDCLSRSGMESVVRNLAFLEKPWCCPHGRPVLKILYQK